MTCHMMYVYAFGYNQNGQIECKYDDKNHLHSDFCHPVRLDLSLDSVSLSGSIATPTSVGQATKSLAGRQCFADNKSLSTAITSSWRHLICIRNEKILVKGCGVDSDCHSLVLPVKGARAVSSGWEKTAFVDVQGRCHVWKGQGWKEEPHSVTTQSDDVKLVAISVGQHHIAAVTDSGAAGLVEDVPDESSSSKFAFRPILLTLKVKEVSCGKEHVLVLTRIGHVFTLGLGSRGQLGHGTTQTEKEARVVEALEGVTMTSVAAGGWHSTAISDLGDLYTWGWNESGQLGFPSKQVRERKKPPRKSSEPTSKYTGSAAALAIPHSPSRDAQTSPADKSEQFVNVLTVPQVLDNINGIAVGTDQGQGQIAEVLFWKVSCGSRHTIALLESGHVCTWGWNGHGQLGHGDTQSRDTPTVVTYFTEHKLNVIDVKAGSWNTSAIVGVT